jgi:hypothetical protein
MYQSVGCGIVWCHLLHGGIFTQLGAIMAADEGVIVPAQAVGRMVAGCCPASGMVAARRLKSAGLWPAPGPGKRRTPVTSIHLSNLVLALTCGKPTQPVETVEIFRDLPVVHHGRFTEVMAA